jgi:electron transport complex protein RnfD
MGSMNAYGWVMDSSTFGTFIKQFGGLGNMFLGNYPSVIGGSCALLILLCWAYLLWQKDVDWRLSATYLACVFVFSLIIGLIHGAGIWYAVFHVLGGGVLFGAVFMMTDSVTNPITIPGRIIFAVGAAALTLIIRLKASLPDGVLFSILLMNMLTPGIDKFVDGNQIKDAKTIRTKVLDVAAVCTAVTLLVGATCEGKIPGGAAEAAVEGNTATGTADGFGGEVSVTLTVEDGKITECTIVGEKETPAVGGAAIPELTQQILDANSAEIDGVTGATITSTAVKSAAGAALEALGQ